MKKSLRLPVYLKEEDLSKTVRLETHNRHLQQTADLSRSFKRDRSLSTCIRTKEPSLD